MFATLIPNVHLPKLDLQDVDEVDVKIWIVCEYWELKQLHILSVDESLIEVKLNVLEV